VATATALNGVRGLRSVAGDTVIYGASIAAVPVALILATPVLTRTLGTSDFGLMDVLSGAAGVTAIAAMLGMDSAITRSYFDVDANRAGIARAGALVVVAVSSGAALAAVGVWALVVGHDLLAAALAFLTVPLANALAMARLALLLPRRRTRYLLTAVATAAVAVAAAIAGVVAGGVAGYFAGLCLGTAAGFAFTLAAGSRPRRIRALDFSGARNLLRYGLPLVPASAAVWALFAVDRALVAGLRSYEEAGLYGLGAKVTAPMMLATSAFAIAWGPFILSQPRERHDALRARALTAVVAAAAGVMLVLVLFAPLLVRVLAPESFDSAARAVPGVALGWLFWAAATILASEFAVMRRTRVIAAATLVAAAVNLTLNLALVPRYGFVAAAWTTAASFAALAGLYLVLERRTARPPYRYRRLALIGAIAAAGGCATLVAADGAGLALRGAVAIGAILGLWSVVATDREATGSHYDARP
jgi:O-antigen/teichoic acid export membrane protein